MWALNILDDKSDLPIKARESYQRLYHEEWRSSQVIQATAEGNTFRGFLGDYSIKLLQGSDVGPSGVRALPLGCRNKRSGHSTWHYFSSSLFSLSKVLTFLPEWVA